MKRIFGRWIIPDWKTMSSQEKLKLKRLCLVPLFAYGIYKFLSHYALTLLIMLGIYYTYMWWKRRK